LENENFQKRVGKITGGIMFLKGIGYEMTETALYLASPDPIILKQAQQILNQ
jgi:hypothetical protein